MSHLLYDTRTGAIRGQIDCDPNYLWDHLTVDVAALVNTAADVRGQWVDPAGRVRDREEASGVTQPVDTVAAGGPEAELLAGLPAGAWVRIRPAVRMTFDEVTIASSAGSLVFTAPVAGTYRAELVGRWRGGPWDFTATDPA